MKTRIGLTSFLVVILVLVSGCSMVQNFTGQNAGTVDTLWADVPALVGATKVNLDIPLPMQLVIQGFIQAANADNSNDTKLDKFDFIAYQAGMTPQQVSDFYTTEKMKAAGWNSSDSAGCSAGTDASSTGGAGFCVFAKKGDAGKATVLMIIPYQEDQSKPTQIFYVRFEATQKTK